MTEPTIDTNFEPDLAPVPKPSSPLLTIILVVLVVFSLAGMGFLYWQNQQITRQLTFLSNTNTVQPSIIEVTKAPTIAIDATAGWNTYTNNLVNYQFKYPPNWLLTDLTAGKQVEIYFQPDKTKPVGELLFEIVDKTNFDHAVATIQQPTDMVVGSTLAKCTTDNLSKTWCYFPANNHYISLLIVKEKDLEYNKILDQILSTFQLTEPQSPTATNMKMFNSNGNSALNTAATNDWNTFTFTNQHVDFTIEFPDTWVIDHSVIEAKNHNKVAEFSPGTVELKDNQSCYDNYISQERMELLSKEQININGYPGTKTISKIIPDDGGTSNVQVWYPNTYCLQQNNHAFVITFYELTPNTTPNNLHLKILNTFKFT